MVKIILAVLIACTLSGCLYQSANSFDIKKAIYFCGGLENVQEIHVRFDGAEWILCVDGSSEYSIQINPPKKLEGIK